MSQSNGSKGCSHWEREPGIDDDDWDPPGSARLGAYVPEAPPVRRARSRGVDGWWTEPRRAPRAPAKRPVPPVYVLPARDPFGGIFAQDED